MIMKRFLGMIIACFLMFGIVGCSTSTTSPSKGEKIIVTTTIAQIADIVKNVGGEHVEVISLMGPGTDPHLYQASQGDIKKLHDADIIFYNGLHLEGKMNEIFEKMMDEKPTYAVAERIPENMLKKSGQDSSAHDPHVWFDITLWKYAVLAVQEGLSEIDPKHSADFEKNTEKYVQELDTMHQYALDKISEIPEQRRVLVTAHDAFNYFGDAYGLEVMGLQGLSTDSEYGLKDVQSLVDTLVKRNIKAVFIESSISERSINAVVEGSKKKGHVVTIGGELYSDAMGEEGSETGTYLGMFKKNIDTIVSALK